MHIKFTDIKFQISCFFFSLAFIESDGWADGLSCRQRWQQQPEKWRRGKRLTNIKWHIFPLFFFPSLFIFFHWGQETPTKAATWRLPLSFLNLCCSRRNLNVAAGPKGGRGRSQWRTATRPKLPWRATFASWTTGGSSCGRSVRTCPSQRSPGCWAMSGASCPRRRSRSGWEVARRRSALGRATVKRHVWKVVFVLASCRCGGGVQNGTASESTSRNERAWKTLVLSQTTKCYIFVWNMSLFKPSNIDILLLYGIPAQIVYKTVTLTLSNHSPLSFKVTFIYVAHFINSGVQSDSHNKNTTQ